MVSNLTDCARYVPRDVKNTMACPKCKIIMNESQWNSLRRMCPNCKQDVDPTPDYVGMISIMMPKESWVAKWNRIVTRIPGVYAINVPQEMERERANSAVEENEMGDFIVSDKDAR